MKSEVVVVGGGPAGACIAGLLAQRGRQVVILERETFPRYHIGESLTTGVLPVLDALGFSPIAAERYTHKFGGTLLWGADEEPWDFRFRDANKWEYSFQVDRADFDHQLLCHVRTLGVQVLEGCTARHVRFTDGRATQVDYVAEGRDQSISADFVVDASGQGTLMGRQLQMVNWHDDLRNLACWTYFEGVPEATGDTAGDTITENRPDGWLWYIPLKGRRASVGYVTAASVVKAERLNLAEKLLQEINESQEVARLLGAAKDQGTYRTARDWSYNCGQMAGPGWALVGDAAAFVDPLMSAGVGIALRAADGLAASVDWSLSHPALEEEVMKQYSKDYRRMITDLLEFIRYFYDRTKTKEEYQAKAKQMNGTAATDDRTAFATILSGMAGLHEVFADPAEVRIKSWPDLVWH